MLELPEASGSDLTGSDDESDSAEGNWVMHEPSSAVTATADALPNGHNNKRKLKGAHEHDKKAAAKISKQKQRAGAPDSKQDTSFAAEGSSRKQKGIKQASRLAGDRSEPSASPKPQKESKKSKKAEVADEDVFAPVEEFEHMLQDDAPLQTVQGRGKAGKRPSRTQISNSKTPKGTDPEEEYEWG